MEIFNSRGLLPNFPVVTNVSYGRSLNVRLEILSNFGLSPDVSVGMFNTGSCAPLTPDDPVGIFSNYGLSTNVPVGMATDYGLPPFVLLRISSNCDLSPYVSVGISVTAIVCHRMVL